MPNRPTNILPGFRGVQVSDDAHSIIGKKRRKIICAPASFKETLSAQDAAQAMAEGVRRADPSAQVDLCPVGDGGEGTMHALIAALGGTVHKASVTGPLGAPVSAEYAVCSGAETGIVELAQASGLALVPPQQRDPTKTTTFGVGELIILAARRGCASIIVCIGGSATVDGGAGLAQALGAKFFDRAGDLIQPPLTGAQLMRIATFERPTKRPTRLRVACDVTNPLCGPTGAAAVYGPQKGATPSQVRLLDDGLAHLAFIVGGDPTQPGAGAAGGAGFGLAALCGATLERGIDLVLDAIDFHQRCADASLVLTGEGRLDAQSLQGKAALGVAASAAHAGAPTIAIVGSTGPGAELTTDRACGGFLHHYISLADQYGLARALAEAAALLTQATTDVVARFMRET
ncbi:MAG: glycerate kinase [Phycisphaerales bacterium]|nr:glycerate kinase [Phycisphaerales bacterium]